MADALLPEAAEEIFQEMTPYERDIVRVAGDSSNIWRIDDLGYALRSNHVQVLGGPALANFIRKRNHIFCFENGEVWTKFASIDSLPSSKVTNVRISDDLRKKLDKNRQAKQKQRIPVKERLSKPQEPVAVVVNVQNDKNKAPGRSVQVLTESEQDDVTRKLEEEERKLAADERKRAAEEQRKRDAEIRRREEEETRQREIEQRRRSVVSAARRVEGDRRQRESEERRRDEEIRLQRELEQRRRDEEISLQRMREEIRMEVEKIKRDKAELIRLEQERQRVESDNLLREKEELAHLRRQQEESRKRPMPLGLDDPFSYERKRDRYTAPPSPPDSRYPDIGIRPVPVSSRSSNRPFAPGVPMSSRAPEPVPAPLSFPSPVPSSRSGNQPFRGGPPSSYSSNFNPYSGTFSSNSRRY